MAFTDEEIQAVAEQLLPSGVVRKYDTLGVRKPTASWGKVQQSAAAVMLLNPNSPYYLASLLASELIGEARACGELAAALLANIGALRRRSVAVRDVTSVRNASVALSELESAVGSDSPPADVTATPSYSRFAGNVDRFLKRVASNVRQQHQVVPTPEEARKQIPASVEAFKSAVLSLVTRVGYLLDSESNYHDTDLARRVSVEVVRNARALLDARASQLEAATEPERLEILRSTVLELLAAKGVVKKFGAFPPASQGINIRGTASLLADATSPAEGGELVGKSGPYIFLLGDSEETSRSNLYLTVGSEPLKASFSSGNVTTAGTLERAAGDFLTSGALSGDRVYFTAGTNAGKVRRITAAYSGQLVLSSPALTPSVNDVVSIIRAPDVTIGLPPTPYPRLLGVVQGPYTLSAGVSDELRFKKSDGTSLLVTLTPGVRTAAQVVTDINAVLSPATNFDAKVAFSPLLFDGPVSVLGNTISLTYGAFPNNISVGSYVEFTYGLNVGELRQVTVVGMGSLTLDGAALTASSSDRVQVGDKRVVQIVPSDPYAAILMGDRISIDPLTDIQRSTGNALGFYGSQEARSYPTPIRDIVDFINSNNNKVVASSSFVSETSGHELRSSPEDARVVVARRVYGTASWGSGLTVTFTETSTKRVSSPQVGDVVVLRTGPNPGSLGALTAVTSTGFTATFGSPVSAGTGEIEVGKDTLVGPGDVLQVDSGVNAGVYMVESEGAFPIEYKLRDPLLVNRDFDQPRALDGGVGHQVLRLRNRSTLRPTVLGIFDPTGVFSSQKTRHSYGSVSALQLPGTDRNLSEGDLAEFYEGGNVASPTRTVSIADVAGTTVRLEGSVPDFASGTYTMLGAQVAPTPSIVLRNSRTYDFGSLRRRLSDFLSKYTGDLYWIELSRLVNLLLRNENPTDVDCADAELHVKRLYSTLTTTGAGLLNLPATGALESILSVYTVDREVEVDTLLRTYKDQGADRAYDLLLSCRFTDFFGSSVEELSYGGMLQSKIRDISISDLPVDKFERDRDRRGQLISSSPDADFEFDGSDLQEDLRIDPPDF